MSTRKVSCMAHAFRIGNPLSYAMGEDGEVYMWEPSSITGSAFWLKTQLRRECWPLIAEGMQVGYFYFDIEVKE